MSSIGQPKVDVLAEMALDINPSLDIKKFSEGINGQNLSEFFTNVVLFVDGLGFFASMLGDMFLNHARNWKFRR